MSTGTARDRVDTHVWFASEVKDKLDVFAKHQRVSVSAVVQEAVLLLLRAHDTRDVTQDMQRCTRRVTALAQDVAFLTELVGLQFELLMAHLRDIPASETEDAIRRKEKRYAQTVKTLQHRLRTPARVWQSARAAEGDGHADL